MVGWWILSGLRRAGRSDRRLPGTAAPGHHRVREPANNLGSCRMPRRQLLVVVMVRTVLMGVVGVVIGLALAAGLSVFAPVGEARVADPSPGFGFHPLLLIPGALIAFAVVVLLGVWPAVKTTRTEREELRRSGSSKLAVFPRRRAAAPPSALTEKRCPLTRRGLQCGPGRVCAGGNHPRRDGIERHCGCPEPACQTSRAILPSTGRASMPGSRSIDRPGIRECRVGGRGGGTGHRGGHTRHRGRRRHQRQSGRRAGGRACGAPS